MMSEQLQQSGEQTAGDRPFPWRCPRCLQKAVHPTVMAYRARASHDGQPYELDIQDFRISKCSNCGELVSTNQTDAQITQALRTHLRLLTREQILQARDT